jgi:hypothetical protein
MYTPTHTQLTRVYTIMMVHPGVLRVCVEWICALPVPPSRQRQHHHPICSMEVFQRSWCWTSYYISWWVVLPLSSGGTQCRYWWYHRYYTSTVALSTLIPAGMRVVASPSVEVRSADTTRLQAYTTMGEAGYRGSDILACTTIVVYLVWSMPHQVLRSPSQSQ